MKNIINLSFEVKGKMSQSDLQEMGNAIAYHILDTFNDNQTIKPVVGVNARKVKE